MDQILVSRVTTKCSSSCQDVLLALWAHSYSHLKQTTLVTDCGRVWARDKLKVHFTPNLLLFPPCNLLPIRAALTCSMFTQAQSRQPPSLSCASHRETSSFIYSRCEQTWTNAVATIRMSQSLVSVDSNSLQWARGLLEIESHIGDYKELQMAHELGFAHPWYIGTAWEFALCP